MRRRPVLAVVGVALAGLGVACPAALPQSGQVRFPCELASDCTGNQLCSDGLCVAPGTDAAFLGDGTVDHAVIAGDGALRDSGGSELSRPDLGLRDRAQTDSSVDSGPRDAGGVDRQAADQAGAADATPDTLPTRDAAGPADAFAPADVAAPTDTAAARDAAATDTTPPNDATVPADSAPRQDAAPAADAGAPVLFQTDFSSGAAGLTPGDGTWAASAGVLQQTESCNTATDIMVDNGTWTDFRARVRVRFDTTCSSSGLRQAALLVRVVSIGGCTNRYYGCLIDRDSGSLMIAEWNNECVTYDNTVVYTSYETGVWYDLEARIVGNRLDCQVSGGRLPQPVTHTRTDTLSLINSGSVGLATWTAAASFDDLVVEAL